LQQLRDVVGVERLQHVGAHAREQRVVELEGRVFGGRAEKDDRAVLDVRQESVLLRLVEAVHLVDKEHRLAPGQLVFCRLADRRTDLLHPRQHRRELQEDRIR